MTDTATVDTATATAPMIDENSGLAILDARQQLQEMSAEDLLALIQEQERQGNIQEVQEVTNAPIQFDPEQLVGVPFTIVDWRENFSDEYGEFRTTIADNGAEAKIWYPAPYASVTFITHEKTPRKGFFNDGGVGILPVLRKHLEDTGQLFGLKAPYGLQTMKPYKKELPDGKVVSAVTARFATSPPRVKKA